MLNRAESDSAAEVFTDLFPNPAIRQSCIQFLADSVAAAHAASPARWAITLSDDMIRLNVCRIEVLTFIPDTVHVLLDSRCIPELLSTYQSVWLVVPQHRGFYRSVSSSAACDFPAALAAELFPVVRASHDSLIQAAGHGPLNPLAREAHSPGVLLFLSSATGRPIPQPEHVQREQSDA